MKTIIRLVSFVILALSFSSCERDLKPCEGQVDCEEGKDCLYVHAGWDGYFCVKQCETDADCETWENCEDIATSCMQCADQKEVCM
jgi:hypothetical protein